MNLPFRLAHILSVFSLVLFGTLSVFGQTGLVISQIYGGGGNSGAPYTFDYVELYNNSAAAISLNGDSIQYAASTSSTWNSVALPNASVAPGGYFLIKGAPGATVLTKDLPVIADFTMTVSVNTSGIPNFSATTGKIILANTTTAMTVACPTTNVLDIIGYGTANCFAGSAVAAAPSNATADIRKSGSFTGNNSADFTTGAPTPHNSHFSSASTLGAISGSLTTASVAVGSNAIFTITTPSSAFPLTVGGDLSIFGGSNSQVFFDDGTNGDSAANDGTFTATVPIPGTATAAATYLFPVYATDGSGNYSFNTISFATAAPPPPPTVAIDVIQGVKSTTNATVSAYVGQKVTTSGIVTAILGNGFFIQTPDGQDDGNPLTPEGVEVFTSSAPPAAAVIGNSVQVSGTVATFPALFPAASGSHTPATEITSPTVNLLSTGNPLPTPITLTTSMLTPSAGLYQLTPYEGMRVSVLSMTAVSGTNGSITDANEPGEIATSTGYFYAVIGNTARSFREPGIDVRDAPVAGVPANVAHFDDNPERILVDSTIAGGTSLEISTGTTLANVSGVLDFTFSQDSFYDPSRLILDAAYNRSQVTGGLAVQPVAAPASTEFTVASFNIERFFNTSALDDLYYVPAGVTGFNGNSSTGIVSTGQTFQSEAADLTPVAYQRRLQKLSLAIRNVLNTPDIVTIEEVENQSVANDIASQINTDAGVSNLYSAYSTDNSTYYTQDGTGISVGFLVKNTVDDLGVTQFGQNESFTPVGATAPQTVNDRPWLVLSAGIKRTNAKDYPVTVIVNHMRSLSGINTNTQSGSNTRQKKERQAEDIAAYIQTLQAAGKHVISGGDFNAFEFSDGYTDTLATYTNTNVLPHDQVVQPGVSGLVAPPLVDLTLSLPAIQRWSYVEDGNAQVLDHMVVTSDLAGSAHIAYAHIDADFPLTAYNDATTPARASDHDPVVGYFTIPTPTLSATLTPSSGPFGNVTLGASSTGQVFTFTNTGETAVTITGITATGDYAVTNNCSGSVAINSSCSANVVFTPTAAGARTAILTVSTNIPGASFTASLTGTGVSPTLPTIAPTSLTFPSTVVGASSTAQTVTVTNTAGAPITVGAITLSPISPVDYSQTNNCGTSIPANGSCTVSVVFKPTATGTRAGTLNVVITGFAAQSLTTQLSGTGAVSDFTMTDTNNSNNTTLPAIAAGGSAQENLILTPLNGFSASVTVTCAGPISVPTGVTCTPPAGVVLNGSVVNAGVSFTTTSRTLSSGLVLHFDDNASSPIVILLTLSGLLMFLARRASRLARLTRLGGLLTLILALGLPLIGCGHSGPNTNPNGTPAGTYTYTITASGGGQTHTQTVNLVVQ